MHWKNSFTLYIFQKINHPIRIVLFLSRIKRNKSGIKMNAFQLINLRAIPGCHLTIISIRFALPIPVVQITCMINYTVLCFYYKGNSAIGREQRTDLCTIIKNICLIMICSCNLHTNRILSFVDIFRQNRLIIHPHIIKDFKNLRIKMILMKMTAKDDYFLVFIKFWQPTFIIVKNVITRFRLNQESTVINISYLHNITHFKNSLTYLFSRPYNLHFIVSIYDCFVK